MFIRRIYLGVYELLLIIWNNVNIFEKNNNVVFVVWKINDENKI